MKDYEYYNNKGNKEIKDNPKLKSNEFYNRQFQDNKLPGEYFDCRVNGLECELNDDDKFAYDGSEGKSNQTSINDMQDLSNAVNSGSSTASSTTAATNASIVESAGTVVTGAATAVVGAAAAVVAFNAVTKETPKMTVNKISAGTNYVYYDLDFANLDLDKDYDIVIKNSFHTFKIECSNGNQEGFVYDLRPNLAYTLTLVGPHELFTTVEYDSTTFYTLPSEELFANTDMEVFYNDDLTCGINYKSIVHDDYEKLSSSYVTIKQNDTLLFDSFELDKYGDNFVYSYDNKKLTHTGTVKKVNPGRVVIETYSFDSDTNKTIVLDTLTKDIQVPLNYTSGVNFIRLDGNSNLIKEVSKLDKDLYLRFNLYNDNNEKTTIEKKIVLTDEYSFRTLVKQDTTSFDYEVGYYENNEFITNNKFAKTPFVKEEYDATYDYVLPQNENLINIKWKYENDDTNNELADITLLTNFNNKGNNDVYYKVELLQMDYSGSQGPGNQYILIDTYEGTGNPTFYNVPIGEYNIEEATYSETYRYIFRYSSLMNYYLDGSEFDVVTSSVREPKLSIDDETSDDLLALDPSVYMDTSGFDLLSNGKLYFRLYSEESSDTQPIKFSDNIKLKIHYFGSDYNVITKTIDINNAEVVKSGQEMQYLTFNLDAPSRDVVGYYIEYEIPYYEKYGGNIRSIRTLDKQLVGDMQYKATPKEITQVMDGNDIYFKMKFVSFAPNNYIIKAVDGINNEYPQVLGDDGIYYIEGTFSDGSYLVFHLYNENDEMVQNYIIDNYNLNVNNSRYTDLFSLNDFLTEDFAKGKIVYTYDENGTVYNNDGTTEDDKSTINVNLLTGFDNPDPDHYNIYVDYWLEKFDEGSGEFVTVGEALECSSKVANFNSTLDNPFKYYDTFRIKYRIHVESKEVYYGDTSVYYESSIFECLTFTGSNIDSISNDNELKPERYDGGQYTIMLVAQNEFNHPNDQIVTFSADGVESMSFVLGDCTSEQTADGTTYIFTLNQELYEQALINFTINANYTLTEEKLEALGNNYEGNLYKKFFYQILGA